MKIIKTDGVDIRLWCPDVEKQALDQMKIIAKLPYVSEACLMPDGHLGMDMPIGGVVATKNVIVPNMVGSDIGCGVTAVKSDLKVSELTEDIRVKIHNLLHQAIPVGFSRNSDKRIEMLKSRYAEEYRKIWGDNELKYDDSVDFDDKAFFSQLGTLGGGNHYTEVQSDEDGNVWIQIHSGSRNLGKRVGDAFNEIAKNLNESYYSKCSDIPFLPVETEEGKCYIKWMQMAMDFAFLSRQAMIESAQDVFREVFPEINWVKTEGIDDYAVKEIINIHHNFASLENHYGRNVWVHRKGATKALKGMTGIIPGSMGTSSYIVKGLGNHRSFMSCSHGAGRRMGRMEYSRQMEDSYEAIEASLEGVTHGTFGEFKHGKMKGVKDVSEAPTAYKDVEWVMGQQTDLVEPIVKLRPLISVKG